MNDIWWQTIGEGDCHLVLLHGWGLNAQVWDCITPQLASHFTLHLVDLPGYGYAKAAPEIRETWSRLIGGYLADRPSLTGIVIVMDARRPFMPADEWLIDFFSSRSHVRQLWLINKCDQIKRAERNTVLAKARARAQQLGDHVEVQLFSGLKKEGVEELQQRLLTWIDPEGRLSADTPSA